MIHTKIKTHFPHHLNRILTTSNSLYVADYTERTKHSQNKRAIELFDNSPPSDIEYFTVKNPQNLNIGGIPFDNSSFTRPNRSALSQCDCVIYPHSSDCNSWILFLELKYSNKPENNKNNFNKARKQLFKTQYYYKSQGIFKKNNTCYLLASLPKQRPPFPFANIILTQNYLLGMKKKHNVVIRFQNWVEIIDGKKISVV